jgi:low affinity Fe/Cu permease
MKTRLILGVIAGTVLITVGILRWTAGYPILAWAYGSVTICFGITAILSSYSIWLLQSRCQVLDTSLHERRRDERMSDEEYRAGYEHGLGT